MIAWLSAKVIDWSTMNVNLVRYALIQSQSYKSKICNRYIINHPDPGIQLQDKMMLTKLPSDVVLQKIQVSNEALSVLVALACR